MHGSLVQQEFESASKDMITVLTVNVLYAVSAAAYTFLQVIFVF